MLFSFWDETEFILSSETQEQSVSKGAAFKIHVSNAEQREAESGEAKGQSMSLLGHCLTGLVLGLPNWITCLITFLSCDMN